MSGSARRTLLLVVGAIMIGLGLFLALRPLVAPGRPLTSNRWIDMAFAAFFLFRGVHNVRMARRAPRGPLPPPDGPADGDANAR